MIVYLRRCSTTPACVICLGVINVHDKFAFGGTDFFFNINFNIIANLPNLKLRTLSVCRIIRYFNF